MEKTSWYKDKKQTDLKEAEHLRGVGGRKGKVQKGKPTEKKKIKIMGVMYVPFTKGSRLAKDLREGELVMGELSGWMVKIVERGGRRLEHILHKSNPWSGEDCARQR